MKEYLLKVLYMRRCSLPWELNKSWLRSFHGSLGMSLGIIGCIGYVALYLVHMVHHLA